MSQDDCDFEKLNDKIQVEKEKKSSSRSRSLLACLSIISGVASLVFHDYEFMRLMYAGLFGWLLLLGAEKIM